MWSKMFSIGIYSIFIASVYCIGHSEQHPETGCGSFEAVSNSAFDVNDRIRNGNKNSKLLDIGGMASLHNSDTDLGPRTHVCGGILISRNFLLTAAHCMVQNKTERITTISLGRADLTENPIPGPDTYKVEKVFYPTNFSSTPHDYDDIALIKTNRPVIYSKEIWPFCLPESHQTYSDYSRVDISGWGQVDQLANSSPSLQIATIKIVENSRCEDLWRIHARQIYDHKIRKYEYTDGLTAQLLCAGERGVDACGGDSGGPMYYQDSKGRHIVIGIIAKGINCPEQPIVPGFYTNIGNYVDWIYDTTWLPRRPNSTTSSTQQSSPSPLIAEPVPDSCQLNPCGLNAECISRGKIFHCSCPVGYEGNALVNCIQKDPCQPNPCGLNAKCQVHGSGAHCDCPIGYEGNPLTNCIRDTCATLSCPSSNAECVEGGGSTPSRCQCKNGFRRDGNLCLDTCATLSCPSSNAECVEGGGSTPSRCQCKNGFRGNGNSCLDTCATVSCPSSNAECVEGGGYTPSRCQCKYGFRGDGNSCLDENVGFVAASHGSAGGFGGTSHVSGGGFGGASSGSAGGFGGAAVFGGTSHVSGGGFGGASSGSGDIANDPNAAPICNKEECLLPDCFCYINPKEMPNGMNPKNVPQMITITFDDAVNTGNIDLYEVLFGNQTLLNPNSCAIKGTFFVSHKYSNYSAVQELHRLGHEIAVHSISHNSSTDFWTNATEEQWTQEMAGARVISERFANITDQSIIGMRAPFNRVGSNKQFKMMEDQAFLYDSSVNAPLGKVPHWPYTLYYRMPHPCLGHLQEYQCPTRSFAVWEMVMNEMDRREDPEFEESLPGCVMVDSCFSSKPTGDQFYKFLTNNFDRHYNTNRAPLGLFFQSAFLKNNHEVRDNLLRWIKEILATHNDVYFVTMTQVIQWMQDTRTVNELPNFEPWKDKCIVQGQPMCYGGNNCQLNTQDLPGETLFLPTCMTCPNNYPWLQDPTGEGYF